MPKYRAKISRWKEKRHRVAGKKPVTVHVYPEMRNSLIAYARKLNVIAKRNRIEVELPWGTVEIPLEGKKR